MVDKPIGVREAARILDVHENTVRNWIKSGRLNAVPMVTGAHHRKLSRAQVERVAARLPEVPDYSPDVDAAYEHGYRTGWRDAVQAVRAAVRSTPLSPNETRR